MYKSSRSSKAVFRRVSTNPLTVVTTRKRPKKMRLSRYALNRRSQIPVLTRFTTEAAISLHTSLGWNSQGPGTGSPFSLVFTYTANQINFAIGTNAQAIFGFAFPNSGNYQAIYDAYKIKRVDCTMWYSSNNSSENTPVVDLPLVCMAEDENDDLGTTSLGTLTQYRNNRTVQFGNSSGTKNGAITFALTRPSVQENVQQYATSAFAETKRSPKLFTASPNVEHNAFKLFYDSSNPSSTVAIGRISFRFDVFIEWSNQI